MTNQGSNNFEVSVLRFPNDLRRWHLVRDFAALRQRVFIKEMGWDLLQTNEGFEFEQYDTFAAIYVIAHRGNLVLGGARLLRTDRECPSTGQVRYSYMIRDAYLGRLHGLPSDVCADDPPVSDRVWELTRLASVGGALVGGAILNAANDWLRSQDAEACLFLGPPTFMRMARSMGYDPKPMGKITGNGDGRFLAFSCPVVSRSAAAHGARLAASAKVLAPPHAA